MYEIFEHTADLGIRVHAATLEQLFADAARGLLSVIAPNLNRVRLVQQKQFSLAGDQYDYLMLDWLNELLYAFESEKLLLADFDVHLSPASLSATGRGETYDVERHGTGNEVKAITYHGLSVQQRPDGWGAEVIVDI